MEIIQTVGLIVIMGVWVYAIKKLGFLWGLTIGWVPAGIAGTAVVLGLSFLGLNL